MDNCSCGLVICTVCKPGGVVPAGPTTLKAAITGDTWAGYTFAQLDAIREQFDRMSAETIQRVWEVSPGKDPYAFDTAEFSYKMRIEFGMGLRVMAGDGAPPFILPPHVEPKGRW